MLYERFIFICGEAVTMGKALVVKLGAIGDVLRTTCILQGLKEKYDEIFWLTKQASLDILKGNDLITKVYVAGDDIKERFDLVISLDDGDEALDMVSKLEYDKLIGAYVKDGKAGYTDEGAGWFDMSLISRYGKDRADELKALNRRTYQSFLEEMLGIKVTRPMLKLDDEAVRKAEEFKDRNKLEGKVIGVNTGAGKRWKQKSWGVKQTIELINRLDCKVLLFGGPEEIARNKQILEETKAIDAGCDNTLQEFAALVNLCDQIVTSDSLAMHIALGLGKRVVVLFGPTSNAEIELYGLGRKVFAGMECLSCYKQDCNKKPNCMDSISVEMVLEALK